MIKSSLVDLVTATGFTRDSNGKESACQCRRPNFDYWVGKMPWRRKWQSTPAFLPGKSHGQRSLAGYSPCNCKESDMTEQLTQTYTDHKVEKMFTSSIKEKYLWCCRDSWELLDCKEIQPVHPKGNPFWIFIGSTDVKLKLQSFHHLIQRTDSLGKTLMLGKI